MMYIQYWGVLTLLAFQTPSEGPMAESVGCPAAVSSFETELWAKVAATKCLTCHAKGGDAQDSEFLLLDPDKMPVEQRPVAMRQNLAAFTNMAMPRVDGEYKILLKVVGRLDHGGEDVLPFDSPAYRVLADFVHRSNGGSISLDSLPGAEAAGQPFFAGVTMIDDRRLLRRATLSLAGRNSLCRDDQRAPLGRRCGTRSSDSRTGFASESTRDFAEPRR